MMSTNELFDLNGQISVVTGGARGLGLSISEALAQAGSEVIICSRKIENYKEQIGHIKAMGHKCEGIKCDITNPEDVRILSKYMEREYGRVDILVNNAAATWEASIFDYPLDKWDKVMNTNVTGTFLCCQALGGIMVRQRKGKILIYPQQQECMVEILNI